MFCLVNSFIACFQSKNLHTHTHTSRWKKTQKSIECVTMENVEAVWKKNSDHWEEQREETSTNCGGEEEIPEKKIEFHCENVTMKNGLISWELCLVDCLASIFGLVKNTTKKPSLKPNRIQPLPSRSRSRSAHFYAMCIQFTCPDGISEMLHHGHSKWKIFYFHFEDGRGAVRWDDEKILPSFCAHKFECMKSNIKTKNTIKLSESFGCGKKSPEQI